MQFPNTKGLRSLAAAFALLVVLAEPGLAFQGEVTGGAIGDGLADDTAALQGVLDAGETVVLGPGKTYRITRRLDIRHDNGGVTGDGTATLLMDPSPSAFDNEEPKNNYAADAVGILADGVSGPTVSGVRIRYDHANDERIVKAIAFRRCADFRITGNDISGFAKADGIVYVGACTKGKIQSNVIHDGYTNSLVRAQISGIVLDDDDQGSSQVEITANRIFDLAVGPDFAAKYRVQTDGINLTVRSHDILVAENDIFNVGEGVDSFATDVAIIDNRIDTAHQFGIKLIHGASRTTVARNVIRKSGTGGIVLNGSRHASRDTADNVIEQNTISGVNADGVADNYTTFGISILRKGTKKVINTRIVNNVVDANPGARVGLLVERDSGHGNVVSGNTVTGGRLATYRIDPGSGRQE